MGISPSAHQRSHLIRQILVILVVLAAVLILFNILGVFRTPSAYKQITFKIESSGGYAAVVITDDQHQNMVPNTVNTPWNETRIYHTGSKVFLEAANPSGTGTLTCEILVDNQSWKAATGDPSTNKVACSGIVP